MRLDLKESREEEEGHSTCREAEDKKVAGTNSGESGARNLETDSKSREYVRVYKVEDSHRHKMEQCL